MRAVDGHNRRLAQRSKGGDGAAGAPRADADDRSADMLDERLDWAARKAAAAAAADESDDDDGSADDKRAQKGQKKALKREAEEVGQENHCQEEEEERRSAKRRRREEADEECDEVRAAMGFGGFASTAGRGRLDNRTARRAGGALGAERRRGGFGSSSRCTRFCGVSGVCGNPHAHDELLARGLCRTWMPCTLCRPQILLKIIPNSG